MREHLGRNGSTQNNTIPVDEKRAGKVKEKCRLVFTERGGFRSRINSRIRKQKEVLCLKRVNEREIVVVVKIPKSAKG